MSELIDNLRMKKDALKHLILQLHEGTAPEAVRAQVARLMGEVPYGLVVEVEQELIESGDLPIEEVQRLCDVHSQALRGQIDLSQTKEPPAGHPIDVFRRENRALEEAARSLSGIFQDLRALPAGAPAAHLAARLAEGFRRLLEVDRHYRRKENLLFPYLEKRGISGPSQVMWGKDDEARELLRAAVEAAEAGGSGDAESLRAALPLLFEPAAAAVEEMIFKEEQILFPMSLDTLTEAEWRAIARQSPEIGFALLAEVPEWTDDPAARGVAGAPAVAAVPGTAPGTASGAGGSAGAGAGASAPATAGSRAAAPGGKAGAKGGDAAAAAAPRGASAGGPSGAVPEDAPFGDGFIRLPSGAMSVAELTAILNLLPIDVTFVDRDDRVRWFSQGAERIFDRNVAILGRKVQQCHPPSSVHVVQKIVEDFRSGRQDRAPFWIQLGGRFVHIEYFAVRGDAGEYLGTLEVTQDLTKLRQLEGEQRLLSYAEPSAHAQARAQGPAASGSGGRSGGGHPGGSAHPPEGRR